MAESTTGNTKNKNKNNKRWPSSPSWSSTLLVRVLLPLLFLGSVVLYSNVSSRSSLLSSTVVRPHYHNMSESNSSGFEERTFNHHQQDETRQQPESSSLEESAGSSDVTTQSAFQRLSLTAESANGAVEATPNSSLDTSTSPPTAAPRPINNDSSLLSPTSSVELSKKATKSTTVNPAYPEIPGACQPYLRRRDGHGRWEISLRKFARFVLRHANEPNNNNTATNPHAALAYNHTCFALKARYNCVPPPGTVVRWGQTASDWQLVLTARNYTVLSQPVAVCDLRREVQELRGPQGLAEILLARRPPQQQQRRRRFMDSASSDNITATTIASTNTSNSPIQRSPEQAQSQDSFAPPQAPTLRNSDVANIVIMGNSYLRQIWESITCQYQHVITDGFFEDGGPPMGLDGIRRRHGKPIAVEELGSLIPFDENDHTNQSSSSPPPFSPPQAGCSGAARAFAANYHTNVTLHEHRLGKIDCNDNIAMVELHGRLRVWYLFQPNLISDWAGLFRYMGLTDPSHTIDVLVWNGGSVGADLKVPSNYKIRDDAELQASLRRAGVNLNPHVLRRSWNNVFPTLVGLQKEKREPIPRFFGADNPKIRKPPDSHPCMPGMPEDEVALLFFAIMFDADISAR